MMSVLLLVVAACRNDKGELPVPKTIVTVSCDTTKLSYCSKIKAIINANCAVPGCHVGNFAYGNLSTYAGVKAKVDQGNILQQKVDSREMPKFGTLSESDIKLIDQWITAGAPEQ